jgi:hypothetical protein
MYIRTSDRRNTLLAPAMSPSGEWTVLVTVSSGYQDRNKFPEINKAIILHYNKII